MAESTDKLVQRLQKVRDRAYALSDRFGIVGHVDAVFKDKVTGLTVTAKPRPRLVEPDTHTLYKYLESDTVSINKDDKVLQGVSRAAFTNNNRPNVGGICQIEGKPYSIMWVLKNGLHDYDILVRPERLR